MVMVQPSLEVASVRGEVWWKDPAHAELRYQPVVGTLAQQQVAEPLFSIVSSKLLGGPNRLLRAATCREECSTVTSVE